MTVVDFEEKCRSLGIEMSDYSEAVRLQGRMIYKRMQDGDNSIGTAFASAVASTIAESVRKAAGF